MTSVERIEERVLALLLEGRGEILSALQKQIASLRVKERKLTGVGFITEFVNVDSNGRLPENPTFTLGDVSAKINGLQNGAGFVLFVRDGYINTLEGYTYDEPWPECITEFDVFYSHGKRDEETLIKSIEDEIALHRSSSRVH